MFFSILVWICCLYSTSPRQPTVVQDSSSITISGTCWDVTTGVDLKTRVVAGFERNKLTIGESDAAGLFTFQLPDTTKYLSFVVEGYKPIIVPVNTLGKIEKSDKFRISLPMILKDSQQVARIYQPGDQRNALPSANGPGRTFFQVKDARSGRRLPATICLTYIQSGRTKCFTADSTRLPSSVRLDQGEKIDFEVRVAGYQTYQGSFRAGQAEGKDELYQIRILPLMNVLAVSYDVPDNLKIHYEFRYVKSQAYTTSFDFPLLYFDRNNFKPGEDYQFTAAAADGRLLMNEILTLKSGLNFKAVHLKKIESNTSEPSLARSTYPETKPFANRILYFNQSSYELRQETKSTLDSIASFLLNHGSRVVNVTGYTDNVGEQNLNRTLSEYRARTVMNYLLQKGVQPGQIIAIGKGSDSPAASNDLEESKSKNRRVVIQITQK